MSNRIRVGLLIAAIAISGLAIWAASHEVAAVEQVRAPAPGRKPAPKHLPSWVAAPLDAGPEEGLPLPDDHVYRMRVMSNGVPVAGASVSLFLKHGPRHHGRAIPSGRAVSRRDGWVLLPDVMIASEDEPVVYVNAEFHFVLKAPFVDKGTLLLDALPPMQGRVLMPDRTPAAEAIVSAEFPSPLGDSFIHTTVGADGRFSLKTPNRGPLVASRGNFSARFEGFDGLSRENPEIEIVLKEDAPYGGKVVGRDGKPLEAVDVAVAAGAASRNFTTAADGTWKGGLFGEVNATLTFTKAGYVTSTMMGNSLKALEGPVVLSRPGRIEGVIVDHEGLPASNASVSVDSEDVSVGEDGAFVIENISDETVDLQARLEEANARQTVAVPEGQTVRVRLMLPPALIAIDLEVVNIYGEEVVGWEAVATPVPATGWTSRSDSLVDGKLGLRQGRFRIGVTSDERELSGETTVDVNPAVDDRPIRVVVHAADGGRGRRSQYDHDPVGSVKVKVVTPNGEAATAATVECGEELMQSLGGGVFECPFFANTEGAIVIAATLGESSAVTHATMAQKEVTLTVRPKRTIRGKVLGTVPPGAYLDVTSSAEQQEVPLTGNDFALEDRAPIRTIVCVSKRVPAQASEKLGCAVAVGDEVLSIPLGGPGTLQMVVVDEKGVPVEKPILYIDRNGGGPMDAAQGRVAYPLVPGTHVVIVNASGSKARAELLFTIRPGQTTDLGTVKMQ